MTPTSGETPRAFHVCANHRSAEWNQPQLEGDDCVLCRLFYLEAQESLLEEWQQRADRAEDAIKEIERPLDAQMARLNEAVTRLNEEKSRLERELVSMTAARDRTAELLRAAIEENTKLRELAVQQPGRAGDAA